jgi:hypothetical protein
MGLCFGAHVPDAAARIGERRIHAATPGVRGGRHLVGRVPDAERDIQRG